MNKWDKRFLELARLVASWSKDPSTKCGAVIVDEKRIVSLGFNGFPVGTCDDAKVYDNRDEKYRRVIHAEQNAMAFANRHLFMCTIYVWPMPPCAQCAAMIIQRGIERVVCCRSDDEKFRRWDQSIQSGYQMFDEAGVEVDQFNAKVLDTLICDQETEQGAECLVLYK